MLSNPSPHAVRVTLSDGSVRVIGPWGLAMLPEYGRRLEIMKTEFADLSVPATSLPATPRAA
jgi:hypothetical protein